MLARLLTANRPIVRTYEVNGWDAYDLGKPRWYFAGVRIPRALGLWLAARAVR